MGTVRSILESKAVEGVLTTTADATVYAAIAVMAEHGIGALVVTAGEQVVGIVTERDYLRKVALQSRSSRDTAVEVIMSSPVVTVGPSDRIEACMALMTTHRCRHLPVVDEGRLVGLVSIGDCVKRLVQEQKDEIHFRTDYIGGRT